MIRMLIKSGILKFKKGKGELSIPLFESNEKPYKSKRSSFKEWNRQIEKNKK